MDLRDLWRLDSRVTPRYVLWLVGQLPPDSAFGASVRGGSEHRPWTPELHLLAATVNLLAAANRQRAGKRGNKPLVQPPKSHNRKPRVLPVAEISRRQQQAAAAAHANSTRPEAGAVGS